MAGATDSASGVDRLSANDRSLPFLATQAAIELDNLLLGNQSKLTAVAKLAQRLEQSTEEVAGSLGRKSLMDPATVSLISNAISASGVTQIRTLSDLASEAWQIATQLQGSAEESDKQRIERMRSFCVYLAQSAVAHERSLFDTQSANRNWS